MVASVGVGFVNGLLLILAIFALALIIAAIIAVYKWGP